MFFLERETCYTYILSVFCLLKEEFQIIGKFLMAGPMNFPLLPFFSYLQIIRHVEKGQRCKVRFSVPQFSEHIQHLLVQSQMIILYHPYFHRLRCVHYVVKSWWAPQYDALAQVSDRLLRKFVFLTVSLRGVDLLSEVLSSILSYNISFVLRQFYQEILHFVDSISPFLKLLSSGCNHATGNR